MFTTYCQVDDYMNDYMLFCWYRGCWPEQWLYQVKDKFLYILRAFNDAAIVWYEGVPSDRASEKDTEQFINLSESTGQTAAAIFKDLTGFYPIPKSEQKCGLFLKLG